MEKTSILNSEECGFNEFFTIGGIIFGCVMKYGGMKEVPTKLKIKRVIIIKDTSRKTYGFFARLGLADPELEYDVDADIYLEDGSCIQIHSNDPRFLKKLMKYVWELNADPRIKFYSKMQHVELDRDVWNRTQL